MWALLHVRQCTKQMGGQLVVLDHMLSCWAGYLAYTFVLPDTPDKGLMRYLQAVQDASVCGRPTLRVPCAGIVPLYTSA